MKKIIFFCLLFSVLVSCSTAYKETTKANDLYDAYSDKNSAYGDAWVGHGNFSKDEKGNSKINKKIKENVSFRNLDNFGLPLRTDEVVKRIYLYERMYGSVLITPHFIYVVIKKPSWLNSPENFEFEE